MNIELLDNESLLTLIISIIAIVLSLVALYYTIKSFLLKSGHKIRCDISICSTIECNDQYVSSITLENLKDRATVIFAIYLKLGHNNYLVLEEFEKSPMILKPFEIYHKEYGPILFYSVGLKQAKLNNLLNNRKIYRKIILSTTDGKYIVNANTKKWSPVTNFFQNFYTAIIYPKRYLYDGIYYGSNVKFLVEFKNFDETKWIIALHNNDYRVKRFSNFALTEKSLESVENLETFIKSQKTNNKIKFDELKVIDFQERVKNILSDYESGIITLKAQNFIKYNLIGKIYTYWQNRKTLKQNRKLNKR